MKTNSAKHFQPHIHIIWKFRTSLQYLKHFNIWNILQHSRHLCCNNRNFLQIFSYHCCIPDPDDIYLWKTAYNYHFLIHTLQRWNCCHDRHSQVHDPVRALLFFYIGSTSCRYQQQHRLPRNRCIPLWTSNPMCKFLLLFCCNFL